jgi:predicted lipoprotein with Yx(FWY)xxD motif
MTNRKMSTLIAALATTALMVSGCGGADEEEPAAPPASATDRGDAASGALSLLSGTAESNNAETGTGDWAYPNGGPELAAQREKARKWSALRATSADDLDPVVVNGAGLTLYRFDDDDANPSKSNCAGQCAETWPPVSVRAGSKVFIAGVAKEAIGFVKRDDGTLQITLGGWPVYRFSKDTRPGDTKGQGVGGTWFGVTPDGQRASGLGDGEAANGGDNGGADGDGVVVEEPGDAGTPAAQPGNASVTLFEEPGFAESGFSMGLSGPGCQNVPTAGVTSSVQAGGTVRMWAQPDCKGKVLEITGDVPDLAALDFDDTVASVRIVS